VYPIEDAAYTSCVPPLSPLGSDELVVGCVTEDNPKYLGQTLRLLQSIRWFGGSMAGVRVVVGAVVSADEIAALITLWREDGARGMASTADRVMREAFARFRDEHRDRQLRQRVRRRTARQWLIAARRFFASGHRREGFEYVARGGRCFTVP
jgi:hypothetical protein